MWAVLPKCSYYEKYYDLTHPCLQVILPSYNSLEVCLKSFILSHCPSKETLQLLTSTSTWRFCPAQSKRASASPMAKETQAGGNVPHCLVSTVKKQKPEWPSQNGRVGSFKCPSLHRNIKRHTETVSINFVRTVIKSQRYIATKKALNQEKVPFKMLLLSRNCLSKH